MLSKKLNNSKKPGLLQMAAGVMHKGADTILNEQAGIADTYYNQRTGDLVSDLKSKNFTVMVTSSGVTLVIDYLKYIRFLDMKKTVHGKKKKIYHPIYNKPLYGYIYNFIYPKLKYGLAQTVREQTVPQLKVVFNKPIEITA